jgi:hypothetical protein
VELRERRLAQIVRDFMEAFVLSLEIGRRLREADLEYDLVKQLVGEEEGAILLRLKEECHALFRVDAERPLTEVQAEELFDLAVGALFHESMKFREGYYLTTRYGPRLQRMMAEGWASGSLAEVFWRVFEAGRRRMLESEAEVDDLFRETRDQLLIVLRQIPESGAVARSLVENPERTQQVFGVSLTALLGDVYGSAARGLELAVESLIQNGHYAEAEALLAHPEARSSNICLAAEPYARGMACYYGGEGRAAVDLLSAWAETKDACPAAWRERAGNALRALAAGSAAADPRLAEAARHAADALSSGPGG